jgi:predicted NAD/FAD-dependent oxidoreductase
MRAVAPSELPVVVVGGGLTGLTAAAALADAGRPVVVLEADHDVGGRLATRQVGQGLADVGAQFFTTRSVPFTAFVADLLAAGVAYEWCRGFNEVDGYPRYAIRGGMVALARHLAGGLDVRSGATVRSVAPADAGGGWQVDAGEAGSLAASAVVVTPPIPVTLGLLGTGATGARGAVRPEALEGLGRVAEVRYHKVFAVVAELDRPPAIPAPGARQLDDGPFSFVADNLAKGLSDVPCVTLHAAHQVSAERWDREPGGVLDELLSAARPWLGDAAVRRAELHAWARSGPVTPWPDRCARPAPGLVLAGDAFGGPKVEGAWLSGRAAAEAVLTASADEAGRAG